MTTEHVAYELNDDVARVTLNRAGVSNAVDLDTARLFRELIARSRAEEARALVLSGSGPRFCAGGDVASMWASEDRPGYLRELAATLELGLREMAELPFPTIAAAQGAVAGAGIGVLLHCDVVVAARSTRFVMAYAGVGLTPDCGVSYLLPRAVGQQRALEFALTGRVLTAPEAQAWGLVTTVAEDDALAVVVDRIAATWAKGPTEAFGEAKRLLRTSWEASSDASARDEVETIARAVQSADAVSRIAAFIG